jgi:hypothetical protein
VSLVDNEQTKLTATALNNIAVAFVIAGVVAPVVQYGGTQPLLSAAPIAFSLIWLLAGEILHLFARRVLRRLKP